MQDTSGVHVWLVLGKAFRALAAHAGESLNLSRTGLGESDFRVLEALLHKGPLPVNTIGPKVWLTPGSISVAVDRLEHSACETEEYRRPARTPGRTHGEGARPHHQDFSGTRGRDGRRRRRPLKRGTADVAAAPQKTGKRRGNLLHGARPIASTSRRSTPTAVAPSLCVMSCALTEPCSRRAHWGRRREQPQRG